MAQPSATDEEALAALPEIYREVLILRDIDELNIAETSAHWK